MFDHYGKLSGMFKMMAKVIGKSGVFLKQIKMNCAEAFPNLGAKNDKQRTKPHQGQSLRIELTKVFSPH